jgi:hypothetical protein
MYQTLINLKMKYNLLKYRVAKMLKVAHSPLPAYILVEHRDSSGKLLYHNAAALINAGEETILKGWFQGVAGNVATNFKVNLATDATIAEDATTYTAVSGSGYAEVAVAVAVGATGWVATKPVDTWIVTSKTCLFSATGTWSVAKKVVLSATLGGVDKIIAFADLVGDRQLYNLDTLSVSLVMSLE